MRRWLKVAGPLGLAAVLVSVLAIGFGSAGIDAAPGGNGKGKALGLGNGNGNGNGNGDSTTATLYAEPDPADAGSVVRIKGCGYSIKTSVVINIEHNGTTETFWAWVFSDGCFDGGYQTAEAGTYVLQAFQQSSPKMTMVAEGTLEVQ